MWFVILSLGRSLAIMAVMTTCATTWTSTSPFPTDLQGTSLSQLGGSPPPDFPSSRSPVTRGVGTNALVPPGGQSSLLATPVRRSQPKWNRNGVTGGSLSLWNVHVQVAKNSGPLGAPEQHLSKGHRTDDNMESGPNKRQRAASRPSSHNTEPSASLPAHGGIGSEDGTSGIMVSDM
ncbi:hypothetical protein CXG81DRAFT_20097 [Caulochytrium protostelioides]|uniref:Uncharacterized protein n=1 Tax=Caulochytrium protostelioides TaxID=1555241 RepID=A0A4P9X468_9FUNG|nr:hypothetical protein CXG81DRAFT_20097 [Caulochytrium protostelioides]|eukprot:RKO99857.1 hypothetical protein CXG81DRAFT_20097 [Caulochytrium protostelioides]